MNCAKCLRHRASTSMYLLTFRVRVMLPYIAMQPVHRLQICPIVHNWRASPTTLQVTSGSVQ